MSWILSRAGLVAAIAIGVAGCDRLGLGPQSAEPTPVTTEAQPPAFDLELAAHAGETYPAFAGAAGARYAPDALGLTASDRARLWRAMAEAGGGQLLGGGGAEALVFKGCAETGCTDGAAIVAVDTGSGAAFAGVRDAGGLDVLAPNDRLEALLRLNSPTRSWENPAPTSAAPTP